MTASIFERTLYFKIFWGGNCDIFNKDLKAMMMMMSVVSVWLNCDVLEITLFVRIFLHRSILFFLRR